VIGFRAARVGLDPGTANTLVYVKGRGVAINEPSLVTVRTSTGEIAAAGEEAEAGLGRTPRKFRTARPVRAGSIVDLGLFAGMLRQFLGRSRITGRLRRLDVAVAVPGGIAEAGCCAVVESLRSAGASSVLLVDRVLAAARGAGVAREASGCHMVVDIGAGVTGIAILSGGSIVQTRAIQTAGDDMDAAITAYAGAVHRLIIGERTAERLKVQMGSALPGDREWSMRIKGRCATRGIPREAIVRDGEIREALAAPVRRIASAVREALEQVPPEVSARLTETGIVLAGGSALLRDLPRYVGRECGLPVTVAPEPLFCVVLGLAQQLEEMRRSGWRRTASA